jgi:hypothetical protein
VWLKVVAAVLGYHPHLGRIRGCADRLVVAVFPIVVAALVLAVFGFRGAVVVFGVGRRAVRRPIVGLRPGTTREPNSRCTAGQLEHPSARE